MAGEELSVDFIRLEQNQKRVAGDRAKRGNTRYASVK